MSLLWFCVTLLNSPAETPIETPRPTDDRLVVELVAREPEIVTPTGIAVDERGRIWAIENQTHHRPADYKGPLGDRIRIYDDFAPDGRARRVQTFAEGFKNGMGLALAPNGDLYFATRAEIMILRDTDGDDVADKQEVIVKLDTAGDYPHNGLSGFAFDAFDNVYFGFGENLGATYKLIGSDGTTLTGGGEGGNIYRCRPDGSKLLRVATGFWNPFHLTFDAFGRLFAVDNDPDSRPPCRLLHIIPGGDYGYRFRNGRKGLHPFTAWNGELPGTLPMVAGTGEAPSGIVAYESNGLPAEYLGDLIVTSWGDHVIQRFKLAERGASFTSQAETLVRGGENFYPVGIAIAPDGSLVVSDWADKSYPLHGKGRIWRIRMKEPPPDDGLRPSNVSQLDPKKLEALLDDPRRNIRTAAANTLVENREQRDLTDWFSARISSEARDRNDRPRAFVHIFWAACKAARSSIETAYLSRLTSRDRSPEVRAEAVRLEREIVEDIGRKPPTLYIVMGDKSAYVRMQAIPRLLDRESAAALLPLLADPDPFIAATTLDALGQDFLTPWLLEQVGNEDARVRVGVLLALRRTQTRLGRRAISGFLEDADPGVRRAALQWVGEERLADYEPLERVLSEPPISRDVFEAYLAAKEMLAGVARKPTDEPSGEDLVAKILADPTQHAAVHSWALSSLRPDHPALATAELRRFLGRDKSKVLRGPAMLTLVTRADEESQSLLRRFASDTEEDETIRVLAITGLAQSAIGSADTQRLLLDFLRNGPDGLDLFALRSLRGAIKSPDVLAEVLKWWQKNRQSKTFQQQGIDLDEEVLLAVRSGTEDDLANRVPESIVEAAARRPTDLESWKASLTRPGSEHAGYLVFLHPRGPQCSTCHRVNGRGGNAGPDLSAIGRSLDREKLIRSILEPSKDIAPQYTTWLVALRSGQLISGIILQEDPRGTITLGDADGKVVEIPVTEIEERRAQTTSIMPDNLADRMTQREFRDLLEFLGGLK